MATFLRLNGVNVVADEDAMYVLVLGVAAGEIKGVDVIAAQLRMLYAPDLDER